MVSLVYLQVNILPIRNGNLVISSTITPLTIVNILPIRNGNFGVSVRVVFKEVVNILPIRNGNSIASRR